MRDDKDEARSNAALAACNCLPLNPCLCVRARKAPASLWPAAALLLLPRWRHACCWWCAAAAGAAAWSAWSWTILAERAVGRRSGSGPAGEDLLARYYRRAARQHAAYAPPAGCRRWWPQASSSSSRRQPPGWPGWLDGRLLASSMASRGPHAAHVASARAQEQPGQAQQRAAACSSTAHCFFHGRFQHHQPLWHVAQEQQHRAKARICPTACAACCSHASQQRHGQQARHAHTVGFGRNLS